MPRPRPPEKLYPTAYRLTRKQIRKVQQMGGVAWLRRLIGAAQASRKGRDPVAFAQALRQRNEAIAADMRPTKDVAKEYLLSTKQINAIRRQYRENPSAAAPAPVDNVGKEPS